MKGRILLIDDEVQWLEALKHLLQQDHFDILTVTNAADAREVIDKVSDLNVIITDLRLPEKTADIPEGKTGIRLLEHIRKTQSHLPIIVVSAYLEPFLKELQQFGGSAFVSKAAPDAIDLIGSEIRLAIEREDIGVAGQGTETAMLTSLRKALIEELDRYSPIRERTIYIPDAGSYELIKPLIGFKRDIENRLAQYPFAKNVFLMMKFRDGNRDLGEYITETLADHGLRGVRADDEDWNITKNVFNPIAVLYCCRYGIALFDEPEPHQAYSPNVAYELGMMHYQNKHCLILRHKSLPTVPFDLMKDLYVNYDRDLQVKGVINSWIKQVSIRT